MRFLTVPLLLFGSLLSLGNAYGQGFNEPTSRFIYRDNWGHMNSTSVIRRFTHRIIHPGGRVDPRIDSKLLRAATIAQERANARSKSLCWRYVKEALVAAGAVSSYPKTAYACQAGDELVHNYGFTRLPIHNPYAAPLGAVLVYGGHGAGHVEIRTKNGFVSDYHSNNACYYHLLAVYGKFSS